MTLARTAAALEVLAGASAGNDNESGSWRRIALALETAAGVSTSANNTESGWAQRAALAAEALFGTTGDENDTETGWLKRIVDALESATAVTSGSLLGRMTAAAEALPLLTPASLFGASEPGLFFDFTHESNVSIDVGIEQVNDLSGNDNHAVQATDANQPAWESGYALFDGSNDALQVPALDLSASDAVTVMIALRYTPTAAQKVFVELSPNAGTNANSFALLMNASDQLVWRSHGSSAVTANSAAQVGEQSAVLVGTASISTDLCRLTKNGTQVANSTNDQGSGNYGAEYALNIGARNGGSLFFDGRLHALLIIGRALTADEITATRAWMNARF